MNQLQEHIYPLPVEPPRLLPPRPGHHRALSEPPVLYGSFLLATYYYTW